jgi:hypothetical protein
MAAVILSVDKEKIDNIIEFILTTNIDKKIRNVFLKRKIIYQYVTFNENYSNEEISYSFTTLNKHRIIITFYKNDYIQYIRNLKIKKLIKKIK